MGTRQSPDSSRNRVPASASRQRGAAAVFAAVALVAMLISVLLIINIGSLFYAQRDLQRLATLAALAGVQVGSGCSTSSSPPGTPDSYNDVLTRVKLSLTTNGNSNSPALLAANNGVALGKITAVNQVTQKTDGLWHFQALKAGDPDITAVQVNLVTTSPAIFGSALFAGKPVTLRASAAANQPAIGDFVVSTGLLNLNTGNSPLLGPLLNALFGTSVNLSALNSSGVLNANVTLAGLEAAAGVNNLNDLLNLNTNLTGALNILSQAVSGTGGGLISGLAGDAYSSSGGPTQTYFGDVFNNVGNALNPGINDLVSNVPFVNVGGLLAALGEDAAKSGPIQIQTDGSLLTLLNIPGLSTVQLYLSITNPPKFSPLAPAGVNNTATAADLTLNLRVQLGVNVGIIQAAVLNLGADVALPQATGTLTSLTCPPANQGTTPIGTIAAQTTAGVLTLGSFNPNASGFPTLGQGNLVTLLGVLGLNLATVSLQNSTVSTKLGTASATLTPYDTYTSSTNTLYPHDTSYTAVAPDNSYSISSNDVLSTAVTTLFNSLTASNNLQICLLGICVGGVLDQVLSAVQGLLNPVISVLNGLVNLLLAALGIQLGQATFTMQQVDIGQPAVITTEVPPSS